MFKIGTAIIAAIVLIIGLYVGNQNIKQTSVIQTFESNLEKMGFEKIGNDYCLEDTDFSYHVYSFNRPTIWKLNQNMNDREKFVVGTYSQADSDLKENIRITIRKTRDFTTLNISRGNYLENGISPQIMDKDDYEIYEVLQNKIKKAVKKMDEVYSELYIRGGVCHSSPGGCCQVQRPPFPAAFILQTVPSQRSFCSFYFISSCQQESD